MANVAEELPFAAVVVEDKLDTTCSNCFVSITNNERKEVRFFAHAS